MFLTQFKKKNNPKNWDDYHGPSLKAELKEHMLLEEQLMYCPYCEKLLDDESEGHIEHIKPRDKYPQFFQDYDNLIVSCNNKSTCGMYKGNDYHAHFIHPVLENPKEYLKYDLMSGEIVPASHKEDVIERALYTIKLLNLNEYSLVKSRKILVIQMEQMGEYLEELMADGFSYVGILEQLVE